MADESKTRKDEDKAESAREALARESDTAEDHQKERETGEATSSKRGSEGEATAEAR